MELMSIILFGVIGDLVKRKIYFVLYNLYIEQKFFEIFLLIGLGCREWFDEFFQV